MRIAIGLKAHSGWAALAAVGTHDGKPQVVDRRRLELVDPADAHWSKQPYHAAEGQDPTKARAVVTRGIESARKLALREMKAARKRANDAGHEVAACAILVGAPMPAWTVEEILAVHFRMHKAEGVLFQDALVRAAEASGLRVLAIHDKHLHEHAQKALAQPASAQTSLLVGLGKTVGPPWGKDQKDATLAALCALREC